MQFYFNILHVYLEKKLICAWINIITKAKNWLMVKILLKIILFLDKFICIKYKKKKKKH